jgi:hypothetical protein
MGPSSGSILIIRLKLFYAASNMLLLLLLLLLPLLLLLLLLLPPLPLPLPLPLLGNFLSVTTTYLKAALKQNINNTEPNTHNTDSLLLVCPEMGLPHQPTIIDEYMENW